MIFKIVFKNECHRLRSVINSCEELYKLIAARYTEVTPKNFYLQYLDSENDLMRLKTEEDFSIMIEEFGLKKSIKIYVKEDLNQTISSVDTSIENLEIYQSDQIEEPVLIEEEKEEVVKVENFPIENPDALIEEISVAPKQVDQSLSFATWEILLDDGLTHDNPNEVLWNLKKVIQKQINFMRMSLPHNLRRKFYCNNNWKQLRAESKILQEKQNDAKLPDTICFNEIK